MMELEEKITLRPRKSKASELSPSSNDTYDSRQRYIYGRRNSDDPTANLIDELLIRCNKKDYGANIDFSMLVSYSIRLIKDSDIIEIQNNSLSDEDRVNELVKKYNTKHGTNYTMYEFVLKGLIKKSNKGVDL